MPAEFLRDVVLPPDRSRRARRFWMLPMSIAAHAAGAMAFVIIPLTAAEDPPPPAPLAGPAYMKAQPLPPPPDRAPVRAAATASPAAAPTEAPMQIGDEREVATSGPPQSDSVPDGLDVRSGIEGGYGVEVAPAVVPDPPPPPRPTLVKVGGLVREPRRIVNVAPTYPEIAQRARIEGTVVLEAVIGEDGSVDRVKVLTSVPLLDGAAVDAVKQWRYSPTLLNGVPVSVLMSITVRFTLTR